MSESLGPPPGVGQSLPITVHWTRGTRLWLAAAVTLGSAASLYAVVAPRPLSSDMVRVMGVIALIMMAWDVLWNWWKNSRRDDRPADGPGTGRRKLILSVAAFGAAIYVVVAPFPLGSGAVRVVGVLGLLLFGVVGGLWLILGRSRRVAVRLDERGILDQTTFIASDQPIAWSDLQSVTRRTLAGQEWIVLGHVRPEEFIRRQAMWRRPMIRSNWALLGSPVALHASGLDRSPDELAGMIRAQLPEAEAC